MTRRFGRTELPEEIEAMVRRAVRLEWISLAFLASAVTVVYLVMGSSQAMQAAWAEDLLSLIPPIAFLAAVRLTRRRPSARHPYGYHRAVGVGHLASAVALLAMGLFLVFDSASGLLMQEHPPVGLVVVLGHEVWSGWLMVAAMVYTGIPPVLLGRAKMPLARALHDRVLYADADMNKADWMTAAGSIVGVLGIGAGIWWADSAAALFISVSILRDGVTNMRVAAGALMDERAQTYDGNDPHPLVQEVDDAVARHAWVDQNRSRIRDEGHVFHAEVFIVPGVDAVDVEDLTGLREEVAALDWKLEDVVVTVVDEIPEALTAPERSSTGPHDAD
ncbi:cation diffusion facilitator family transporter [Pseudactinotalea suaedae]|uniref:cation diffusion facilitator family transporter n=1 Tax=Pseudactinotalea suaedae TaxID=1524924 RepID=UPI0012E15644|nr:cation diffusion facilitator family transporter [Pseudactinotalea suaedae]